MAQRMSHLQRKLTPSLTEWKILQQAEPGAQIKALTILWQPYSGKLKVASSANSWEQQWLIHLSK